MDRPAIQPPIIAAEGNDLLVFASIEFAERCVESPDVDNYEVYDRRGLRLHFDGKTEPRGRFIKIVEIGPVRLVADESDPLQPEALQEMLIRCLAAIGEIQDDLAGCTLEQLIDLSIRRFGYAT